ncbi:hypothetical protein ARMGADRAFT_1017229, partial [Armillaria gallica]
MICTIGSEESPNQDNYSGNVTSALIPCYTFVVSIYLLPRPIDGSNAASYASSSPTIGDILDILR